MISLSLYDATLCESPLPKKQLTDMTDLTHGYVRDLECLTINKTPTLETIGKFADALGIDIRQLFDDVDNN